MAAGESFEVTDEFEGLRLDQALVRVVEGHSRSRLQAWIRAGRVLVDGAPAKKTGLALERGMRVEVELPSEGEVDLREDPDLDITVLIEDEHFCVIDKPAGLVAHRNERFQSGTVADLLRARYGSLPEVQGEDRPGIVHRLDRETSGVMVVGRTVEGMEELRRQFKHREVEKTYLALVHGSPRFDSDWIEAPIGTDPRQPDRKGVVPQGEGRDAETYYEVRERFHGFALVACFPKTGRTHQIRVHMTHVGHPLVADRLYRPGGALKVALPPAAPALERQALHAYELAFRHPLTSDPVRARAEPPEDLRRLVEWLREHMPERA